VVSRSCIGSLAIEPLFPIVELERGDAEILDSQVEVCERVPHS